MPPVVDPGGDTFSPGDPPAGICVAFNDTMLEPNPTWTRLDDPAGYNFASSFNIERLHQSETDTVAIGSATVDLIDINGALDPTNAAGPFYGKLNPRLQAAIARWNPVTGQWSTRFRGFTKAWNWSIDNTGRVDRISLQLVDAFYLFARLELTPGVNGDTVPAGFNEGDVFYNGGDADFVHVNQRILQALGEVPWPSSLQVVFSGNVSLKPALYDRGGNMLQVLSDCADAEFPAVANLYVSREGVVTFHGRYARFDPTRPGYGINTWYAGSTGVANADPSVARIAGPLEFRRDEDDVVNVALVTPQEIEEPDVTGQLVEDSGSITDWGRAQVSIENLLTHEGHDDDGDPTTDLVETKKFGQFYVDNRADPITRVSKIRFRGLDPDSISGPATWAVLQGVDIGDIVQLDTAHFGGGGFSEPFYVEGIRETDSGAQDSQHDVTMELDVSPTSIYGVSPFPPCPDNDEMGCAQALPGGGPGTLDWDNTGFSNDGPEADPGGGMPWDPLREQFFTADDPSNPGNPLPPTHNFRTAWFRWTAPIPDLFLHIEVDLPAAGAVVIVTTSPAPPPSNRDAFLASDDTAVAGTVTLDPVASITGQVWIGVGSYVADGGEFTIRWDSAL